MNNSDASAVYLGDTPVDKMYLGVNEIPVGGGGGSGDAILLKTWDLTDLSDWDTVGGTFTLVDGWLTATGNGDGRPLMYSDTGQADALGYYECRLYVGGGSDGWAMFSPAWGTGTNSWLHDGYSSIIRSAGDSAAGEIIANGATGAGVTYQTNPVCSSPFKQARYGINVTGPTTAEMYLDRVKVADITYNADHSAKHSVAIGAYSGVVAYFKDITFWDSVPSPAGLTPPVVGPAIWFDASDASTISATAGTMTEWRDKSGNGHSLTPSYGAFGTGTDTLNGLNVATLYGENVMRTANGVLNSPTLSVFTVMRSEHGARVLWGWPQAAASHDNPYLRFGVFDEGGNVTYRINGNHSGGTSGPWGGAYHLMRLESANGRQHIDGRTTGSMTGASLSFPNSVPLILGANGGNGERMEGYIAEFRAYDYELSSDEAEAVEIEMAAKWGIG